MRKLLIVVLVFVGFIILQIAGCFIHTRHDSVEITEIQGKYHIRFLSRGHWLALITFKGPFPEWTDDSIFQTHGTGEALNHDDLKFVIGKNLESQYKKYESGMLILNNQTNEVVLKASLSSTYRDTTNHTGQYKAKIMRPVVYQIGQFSNQKEMLGKYISATGYFHEFQFLSEPYVFADLGWGLFFGSNICGGHNTVQYKVVGLVQQYHEIGTYEIRIFDVTELPTTAPGRRERAHISR